MTSIRCGAPLLDVCFRSGNGSDSSSSSSSSLRSGSSDLAAGLVSGVVELWSASKEGTHEKRLHIDAHEQSVRCVAFAGDSGKLLCSGSLDKSLLFSDIGANGKEAWKQAGAHDAGLDCATRLSDNIVATGDEEGDVKIWDIRQKKCTSEISEHSDIVYSIETYEKKDTKTLFSTSGDGTLGVHELRMNGKCSFVRASDDQEDELLSLQVIKGGKKVVVGTQEGILDIWSWGTWGDISDRMPGHPSSIDCMVKIDE